MSREHHEQSLLRAGFTSEQSQVLLDLFLPNAQRAFDRLKEDQIPRECARELATELSKGSGAQLETVYADLVGVWDMARNSLMPHYRSRQTLAMEGIEARLRAMLEAAGKLPKGE